MENYYVYVYIDPRNFEEFYYGKGKGNRKEAHLKAKDDSEKTKIIKGFIEQTIHTPNLPEKVCFAYIDFDFYEPILIALQYLDRVLQPGGFVIVDDYNFFSEGVKIAVDEFYSVNRERYELTFPVKSAGFFCILRKK